MRTLKRAAPKSARSSSAALGSLVQRVFFEVTRRYGLWLYHIKLARVGREATGEGVVYEKQRLRRSACLLSLANPFLKATGSRLLGLPEREWLWWESQLAPRTMGRQVQVRGRRLLLPCIPGVRLADYLTATSSLDARCAAVGAAARELYRLHRLTLRFPDGSVRPFSHGDSHAKNVMYDPATGKAIWFDFEAVHVASLPAPLRHADDWRAFSYSAAEFFALSELPQIAATVARTCQEEAVRAELAALAYRLRRQPTVFHLAQAHLDFERHQQFCDALITVLETNPATKPCSELSSRLRD